MISDLRLPRTAQIAAILREDEVLIPENDTVILQGDHVVVYAASREVMKRVEKMFQVSALFV